MQDTSATINLSSGHLIKNKLLEQRKIFLWGQVDEESSKTIVEQLAYLESTAPVEW